MDKYRPGQNVLTNNFKANMLIFFVTAVVLVAWSFFGTGDFSLGMAQGSALPRGVLARIGVFFAAYFFTSYWFNPDLDIHNNRPGKGSFPLSWVLKRLKTLKKELRLFSFIWVPLELILTPIHMVLNFCWRTFWHPFGNAFTHRGIVHWPFVGSQLKILYIFLPYWFVCSLLGLSAPFVDGSLRNSLFGKDVGLYYRLVHEPLLLTAFLGIIIADICHITVDHYDSWRNGTNFHPPAIIAPRGFVTKFFHFLGSGLLGKGKR